MDSTAGNYTIKRNCTPCSHPKFSCDTCPVTVNYYSCLPDSWKVSSNPNGTYSVEHFRLPLSEGDVRRIIKEELEKVISSKNEVGINPNEMSFEEALTVLKAGKRVTNTNWNGDNQYIFMMPGYESVPANEALSNAARIPVSSDVCIAPYLMLRNAQGIYSNWVPSNGDLFSNTWKILDQ